MEPIKTPVAGATAQTSQKPGKPVLTPEQIKARNEANKKRHLERLANIAIIKELVDKQTDKKYETALKAVMPFAYNERPHREGGVVPMFDKFANFVKEKKQVSEEEVFKTFKIGRKECGWMIRTHLKKASPDNRIWIAFDEKTGMYNTLGTGKTAPATWKGYIPAENLQMGPSAGLK